MKSVKDFDVRGKRILVRCDFNVPLNEDGSIGDDAKIKEALPTLRYLLENGAEVTIITHLGDGSEPLDAVKTRLFELLGREVQLLENIRSHKEETENNEAFAKKLALLGDIYINEAFDVCHRAHASVVGIPKFLPHGAGFALEKEVRVLSQIMQCPQRPLVVIVGGAKVETKAKFAEKISSLADIVLVGGLIKGLSDPDLDDESVAMFTEKITQAKTIFWNGPLGKVEDERYAKGTRAIASAIIQSGAYSVVGGGETLEFLRKEGMLDKFSHVSTAGGAMLEFLSGQELPGLKALE